MDRLTEYTDHGVMVREELDICVETPEDFDNLQHILATLAAYEDIELMPEELEKLKDRDKVMKMYKPNPNIYCCPACGEKLAPMWDFCPWCGQHLID